MRLSVSRRKLTDDSFLGDSMQAWGFLPQAFCVPGMFNNLEVKVHSQSDDDEV